MKLEKKLDIWREHGLLNAQQQKDILDFEKNNKKPFFTSSLLALAFFCIGLGTISLISANWNIIPNIFKLSMDILFLIINSVAVIYFYNQEKNNWFEGLLILYATLILASIGLIAQIYQVQSQGLSAFLLWSFLVFPLVIISRKIVLPLIWLPIFTTSVIDVLAEFDIIYNILLMLEETFPYAISISGIILFSYIYRFTSYYFRTRLAPQIKAMKFWLSFDIVSLVIIMDLGLGILGEYGGISHTEDYRSVIVISILILVTMAFGYYSNKYNYSRLLTCVLAILLGFSIIFMALPENGLAYKLWGFALTMSILITVAIYALIKNKEKLLNIATACMAFRLFIVYIQVFGSLLSTGIGLISSGILFLSLIYAWKKLHLNNLLIIREKK